METWDMQRRQLPPLQTTVTSENYCLLWKLLSPLQTTVSFANYCLLCKLLSPLHDIRDSLSWTIRLYDYILMPLPVADPIWKNSSIHNKWDLVTGPVKCKFVIRLYKDHFLYVCMWGIQIWYISLLFWTILRTLPFRISAKKGSTSIH